MILILSPVLFNIQSAPTIRLKIVFISLAKLMLKLIHLLFLCFFMTAAQADNCTAMADMAKDIATLRDAGVLLEAVEKRLKKDVFDQKELAMALLTTTIVYKSVGPPGQLKKAILQKCK